MGDEGELRDDTQPATVHKCTSGDANLMWIAIFVMKFTPRDKREVKLRFQISHLNKCILLRINVLVDRVVSNNFTQWTQLRKQFG
jgi:hypothetical protein